MADLTDVEILTFDCYGTLIDWGTGLGEAIAELAERHAVAAPLERLLAEWEAIQFKMISGRYRKYRDILADSLSHTFAVHGIELPAIERHLLGDRLPEWKAFPDTVNSLTRLKRKYKLAILSNIDDDLLAGSLPKLGVEFEELVTAEGVKSYKPNLAHFTEALRRFERPADAFLHCAFGFKYDQRAALAIGMQTMWVKRPGWIRDDDAEPTFETPDLAGLVDLLEC